MFQMFGWTNAMLYLISKMFTRTTFGKVRLIKYYFVAQPVTELPIPAHRGRNIKIREIGPDDPDRIHLPRPESVIESRFAQGAHCLAAFVRNEMAGFLWYVPDAYQEDEVRSLFIPVPEGKAVWDFDVYVMPEYRNSPVFLRLWQQAISELTASGYSQTCSRILAFNAASLSSHLRLGGKRVGWGIYISAGRRQLAIFSCSPYIHLSLSDHSVPHVRVGLL